MPPFTIFVSTLIGVPTEARTPLERSRLSRASRAKSATFPRSATSGEFLGNDACAAWTIACAFSSPSTWKVLPKIEICPPLDIRPR